MLETVVRGPRLLLVHARRRRRPDAVRRREPLRSRGRLGRDRAHPPRRRTARRSSLTSAVDSPHREVGRRSVPGRLRGAADRPPADGHPGADGQGRRVGAGPLRRRLLQAAQLDVAAVHGPRGHQRRRRRRVDRHRQGRRHAADPDRGDPARLLARARHRPRAAEGRRREAPPGAARRAPRHPGRRADAGPPRVPDRRSARST